MTDCTVYPIPLVEFISDKSTSTARRNIGQKISKGCYVWLIKGSSQNILVDAGSTAENFHDRLVPSAKNIQSIETGLKNLGYHMDEIQYVILTHLHPDHVALARNFKNATFFIQEKEYYFGLNPHPSLQWFYIKKYFENLPVNLIDGDVEISKGVSVLCTPGHSPGGQSVKIKSSKGDIVISGICSIDENFFPPKQNDSDNEVIVPGLYTNQFDVYDNLLKIKNNADIVISNHDIYYKDVVCIPG